LLRIDRAAIVGLSAGARWALDFALAYPTAVSALILADPSVSGFPWASDVKALDAEVTLTYREAGAGAAKRLTLGRPVFATAREHRGLARRLEHIVSGYSGWHWGHDDPVVAPSLPAYERLETIAVPALVIVGERDLADFRDVAEVLAARIPGARRQTFPGVGHLTNMQAPEEFNRAVLDFLAGLPDHQTTDGLRADLPA
jgi:pimeloyl-ACP methyl ester carboxylesterase